MTALSDSTSTDIGVCVIEDHADYRNTLKQAIDSADTLTCEVSFSNAEDALNYFNNNPPCDIIVLDLGLPGMDGIDAIPKFTTLCPECKILVLTVFENKTRVFQALGAGASGYLIKSGGMAAITHGIAEAYQGISPLSSEIAKMVFATFKALKPADPKTDITEREAEVLQQLSEGNSRIMIASNMEVSRHTIDSHIRNIYRKLQVHNVSGALKRATELGIF